MRLLRDTAAWLGDGANWLGDDGIWHLLLQQLLLTFTALGVALAIGLPIALWLGHLGRGGFVAINVAGVGRAVPTFAVLALLVMWEPVGTEHLGPYGRAGLATLIALALFALPPIITNAYVGVDEVPRDVREAADGMGMSGWQRFVRVELPLAMPLVAAGVRLALVQVWATATIAALVDGPGLGNLITAGFYKHDYAQGIGAAVVVAAVALLLEVSAAMVQRSLQTARPDTRGTRPRDTEGGNHAGTTDDGGGTDGDVVDGGVGLRGR
ncbi:MULTISPECIES: ABC transporter permease [unclassified Nocardioides]|uniref:ABC transporter permease n=1 Tax=unclassified Nocardioides TaxID=2615069 RepID=UPI0009E7D151|nr:MULTISPECIES: ABC transporter permease [unclassified Nocardioides]